MGNRVLAVWLDAMDPDLVEEMMGSDELPHLAALRDRGAYGRLESLPYSFAETGYSLVITGSSPQRTKRWAMRDFDPATYSLYQGNACRYEIAAPFFRLDGEKRVLTFDIPKAPLDPASRGIQISNWGCHSAAVPRDSLPKGVVEELLQRYGEHPAGDQNDHANLDNPDRLTDLHDRFLAGIKLRGEVTSDLLRNQPWDLFFTCISETHNAGHYFWPRPECPASAAATGGWRMVRDLYRTADQTLGRMIESAGPEVTVLVFSPEGIRQNCEDIASFVFLPELLARDNFPGKTLMTFGKKEPDGAPPAGFDWVKSIWSRARPPHNLSRYLRNFLPPEKVVPLERLLRLRPALFDPSIAKVVNYQPLTWYQPYWRYMKAFALPTNSDGVIRLNLRGREKHGMIDPKDYGSECERLSALLRELIDPLTGKPAVEEVIRTRPILDLASEGTHLPPGDLIVRWAATLGNRVVSPTLGKLGPVPFHRAGSHTPYGFLCMAGPGIQAGSSLSKGTPADIGPTIRQLIGLPNFPQMDGTAIIPPSGSATAEPSSPSVLYPPRLAMVMCLKNEERFLAENLLYHRALGVGKAYIYLDHCSDRSREIAQSFNWVETMEVDLEEQPRFFTDLNTMCMNHALDLARRDGYDWLLSLDPDEFAFGQEGKSGDGTLSWNGNLPRMLATVAPDTEMVRLPTRELLPRTDLGDSPFWTNPHFQKATPVSREILHPLNGERQIWSDFIGHTQGKSIVRVKAKVQAYDSHRWVVEHGRSYPERADYVPVPTEERGCHLHFLITSSNHWREKYLKFAHVPAVWPCGTPVEFPKQCWKEAAQLFSPEGAKRYFERWVGLSGDTISRLESEGIAVKLDLVRGVLEENGLLNDGKLIPLTPAKNAAAPPLLKLGDLVKDSPCSTTLSLEIGKLSPSKLRGFHPVEMLETKLFRWAGPEAAIQLNVPPASYRVTLKMDQLHELYPGLTGVELNGKPIETEKVKKAAQNLCFDIPESYFDGGQEQWLSLRFKPVNTSSWKGEKRQLGAALFGLDLTPN